MSVLLYDGRVFVSVWCRSGGGWDAAWVILSFESSFKGRIRRVPRGVGVLYEARVELRRQVLALGGSSRRVREGKGRQGRQKKVEYGGEFYVECGLWAWVLLWGRLSCLRLSLCCASALACGQAGVAGPWAWVGNLARVGCG